MRDILSELVMVAEQVTPGSMCCLTLVSDGSPSLLASSGLRAADLEQTQYVHDGPAMVAARSHRSIVLDDLSAEAHWPAYSRCAAASGLLSSMHVPCAVSERHTAVLAVYAPLAHAFGADERRSALRYAEEADRLLALAIRLSQTERTARNLELALESRSTIAQAVGVIMAENRCNEHTAFAILRSASQNRNTKVRDVARHVLEGLTIATSVDTSGPRTAGFTGR